jgi:hypothetical protein
MACDFTFPANTWLAPGEEVMVVKDITLFPDATGLVFQWTDGKLNNEGETILLSESHGILIDYVSYDDATPWPMLLPTNPYIELISADLDNHFASSWQAASVSPNVQEAAQSLFGIYPNPAQDRIMLQGDVPVTSIEIVDMTGRQALFESNGSGLRLIDITSLSDGIYTVIINQEYAQKLVVKN